MQLPEWYENWEKTGLIAWLDDGDGKIAYHGGDKIHLNEIFHQKTIGADDFKLIRDKHQRWLDSGDADGGHADGEDGRPGLRARGFNGPDKDIMVLAVPEMAELMSWIVALVAA